PTQPLSTSGGVVCNRTNNCNPTITTQSRSDSWTHRVLTGDCSPKLPASCYRTAPARALPSSFLPESL
ncbi:hypothetical protein J6590_107487, partial [Homalodisca vitripennis]